MLRLSPPSRRGELLVVLLAFGLSRLVYGALGVRFDAGSLAWYWQFVDPVLLATRPLESLVHLHGQPPLFNAYLAAVLHLPAAWQSPTFALSFAGLGVAIGVGLLALQRELGVPPLLRVATTVLFVASPAAALYENHLFYTYPVLAALVWVALLLHRFLVIAGTGGSGGNGALAGSSLLLVGIVLTRSLFHLVYLAGVMLGVALVAGPARRQALRCAAVAILLAGAWYVRSWVLFDSCSASTWMGMNLSQVIVRLATDEELAALVAAAPEERILAVPPFSPLSAYAGLVPPPRATGVPVLDQVSKSTGAPNFHHLGFVAVGRSYQRAALWSLLHRPRLYLRGLGVGWRLFLRSGADSAWLEPNAGRVEPVERWFRAAQGQRRRMRGEAGAGELAWLLAAALVVAVTHGLRRLHREGWRQPRAATVAFMLFTIGYVALAGNALELGENNRFAFLLQPFVLCLLALLAVPFAGRPSTVRAGIAAPLLHNARECPPEIRGDPARQRRAG